MAHKCVECDCVCVCVWERERESVCVCVSVWVCARAALARICVCRCVCMWTSHRDSIKRKSSHHLLLMKSYKVSWKRMVSHLPWRTRGKQKMHVVPRQKLLCEKQILEEIDKHQGMFPDYQTHRDRYTDSEFANFTLPTLKAFFEARGHNVSGNKQYLVARALGCPKTIFSTNSRSSDQPQNDAKTLFVHPPSPFHGNFFNCNSIGICTASQF